MKTKLNISFSHPLRWEIHEKITKLLTKQAKQIHKWWKFTGLDTDPGVEGIVEALKRLVTGVLTHPVTIGECQLLTINLSLKHTFSIQQRPVGLTTYSTFRIS